MHALTDPPEEEQHDNQDELEAAWIGEKTYYRWFHHLRWTARAADQQAARNSGRDLSM